MMRSKYGSMAKKLPMVPVVMGGGNETSSAIDLQGFKSVAIAVMSGVFDLDGTNYIEILIQESADNTTYTTVAAADLEGDGTGGSPHYVLDAAATDANEIYTFHYKGAKRYCRSLLTEGGTVSIPMSVECTLMDQDLKPSID